MILEDFETRLNAKTYNIEHLKLDARLREKFVVARATKEQSGGK